MPHFWHFSRNFSTAKLTWAAYAQLRPITMATRRGCAGGTGEGDSSRTRGAFE